MLNFPPKVDGTLLAILLVHCNFYKTVCTQLATSAIEARFELCKMEGNASADLCFYTLKEEFANDLDKRSKEIEEAEGKHLADQMKERKEEDEEEKRKRAENPVNMRCGRLLEEFKKKTGMCPMENKGK